MKKIILFASTHCGDCPAVKEALTEAGIKYALQDITSGMMPLKRFLKYRDSRPEFAAIKERGNVGIPCLVVTDENNEERILFELPENLDELR